MDELDRIDRTAAEVAAIVDRVRLDQRDNPSPCSDWTVGRLLARLNETLLEYAAIADGCGRPVATSELATDEPGRAFREAAAVARTDFARPGMLDHRYAFPWGAEPGRRIVGHVANVLVIHGWDLARATGQRVEISPDLAEASLASWQAWFAEQPRSLMRHNFADERAVPADASAPDRLAAYLGRDPRFTPQSSPPATA